MSKDLVKAKQIYWAHHCSHFGLDREGASEEYRRLGGTKEYEVAWRKEYVGHWSAKLNTVDLEPLRQLRHAQAVEAIPALLALNDYGDDYSKFWFAFVLFELTRFTVDDELTSRQAVRRARSLWEEVLQRPIGISETHRREVTERMLKALEARDAEEYLRNYTRRKLEEISKQQL